MRIVNSKKSKKIKLLDGPTKSISKKTKIYKLKLFHTSVNHTILYPVRADMVICIITKARGTTLGGGVTSGWLTLSCLGGHTTRCGVGHTRNF